MIELKSPRRLLWVALALGWGVDWVFYGKQWGISLPVFVLMAVVALFGLGKMEGTAVIRRNLWLIVPLFFFATMFAIRDNPFLTFFNALACVVLLSYLAFFYAAGRVENLELFGAAFLPVRLGLQSAVWTVPTIAASVDVPTLRAKGRQNVFPILRGSLLALPVLGVFTLLLTSADLVFADYVDQAFSTQIFNNLGEWVWRSVLIMGAAWMMAGGLVYALGKRQTADSDKGVLERLIEGVNGRFSLGFMETATVLSLVNLLFLAFVVVQFTYLFGGRINIEANDFTFAEYARRGFFELVTVAVLTLGLILGLNWGTRRESKQQIRRFNALSTPLVGFILIMLVAAFYRMQLYQAEFGHTELRLYVVVFMVWLGLAFGWFLWTLWRRPERFTIGLLLAAMGFLATLNFINPDAFIVRQNTVHYQATGNLDAYYLTTLSDDAVPELVLLLNALPEDACTYDAPDDVSFLDDRSSDRISFYEDDSEESACPETLVEIMGGNLDGRYQIKQQEAEDYHWQSFRYADWQAYQVLAQGY
jgi:hypothetical protein